MLRETSPGEGCPVKDKITKGDLKQEARGGETLPESGEDLGELNGECAGELLRNSKSVCEGKSLYCPRIIPENTVARLQLCCSCNSLITCAGY